MKRGTYASKILELRRKHGGAAPAFLQGRSGLARPKHKKLRQKAQPLKMAEGVLAKIGRTLKQLWSGSRPLSVRPRRRARHGRAR